MQDLKIHVFKGSPARWVLLGFGFGVKPPRFLKKPTFVFGFSWVFFGYQNEHR